MRKGQKQLDTFTHNGNTLTAAGWAEKLKIPKHVFYQRLKRFSDEKLIYHRGRLRTIKMKRTVHGWSKTTTYASWYDMIKRCTTPTCKEWKNYGGRGILVCTRWQIFKNFLTDMGKKPEGLSLDRINNNGNYSKRNCRWASPIEQANNTRQNVYLSVNGTTMNIKDAAQYFRITPGALYQRLSKQRLKKRNYGLHAI